MIENLAKAAQPVLDNPYIKRTRRNHGLEHATVHILTSRTHNRPIAGRSDAGGFWLVGDLATPLVEECVHEALRRMRGGEHNLAIHPNCGTALLTTGTMTGLAAFAANIGVRGGMAGYLSRLPTAIMLSMGAILLAQPLGLELQEHFTTLGDPGDLEVISIQREETRGLLGGKMILHRISTVSS